MNQKGGGKQILEDPTFCRVLDENASEPIFSG